MLINVFSAKCVGIDAVPVRVEVNLTNGLGIYLVGLADAAVKESLLRTVTALNSMGYRIPGKKIVINLAPADIHKKGSGYDLPIAIGILASSEQIKVIDLDKYMIMGELGLDGSVRPVPGALPIIDLAVNSDNMSCILPLDCAIEAMEYEKAKVYGVRNLNEVIEILCKNGDTDAYLVNNINIQESDQLFPPSDEYMDFADIVGQDSAKRGAEIAAAGGHNILLIGSPGSGKSSLAKAMAGILPEMSVEESIATSKIYSVAGKSLKNGLIRKRPFRSPHCSSSVAALVGGGSDNVLPGEISLAHNGILFLDEFCELSKKTIEVLRSPIEERRVVISRLRAKVEYPASFMMVAATNPCPCGYYGENGRCSCTPTGRLAYISKLSGPIIDRIDLHIWMNVVEPKKLVYKKKEEKSSYVAERVLNARRIQMSRFENQSNFTNSEMTSKQIEKYCILDAECKMFLEKTILNMGLSARAYMRILKISRTIADLEGVSDIRVHHIAEAVGYRFLDKKDLGLVI